MNKPGIGNNEAFKCILSNGEEFKLIFNKGWLTSKDVLISSDGSILEPHQKWHQILFQYLTFGWYKAGWYYKVKLVR